MAVVVESKSKTGTATSQWTSVFKTETITTPKQSLDFMRKFAAVGISTILYLRTNLPDDTFSVKPLDGIRVSMLTPSHPRAKEICEAVQNGMKSLKEGYLREFWILFYPNSTSDDIIESHKFSFTEPQKSGESRGSGDDAKTNTMVKKATLKMLRNMATYNQACLNLPDGASMGFRLIYSDETPKDYNPPGFVTLSPNAFQMKYLDGTDPKSFRIGDIATSFHRVDVEMK